MTSVFKEGRNCFKLLISCHKHLKPEDRKMLFQASRKSLIIKLSGLPLAYVCGFYLPIQDYITLSYPLIAQAGILIGVYSCISVPANYLMSVTAIEMVQKYPPEFFKELLKEQAQNQQENKQTTQEKGEQEQAQEPKKEEQESKKEQKEDK